VLRELVNNIITHARASRVEIGLHLEAGRLQLDVDDDGVGTTPKTWAHGLGLGGVRKRVKLLGGQVAWTVREGGGIRCEVRAPLGDAAGDASSSARA
jgi:signal transduction histidine kinase